MDMAKLCDLFIWICIFYLCCAAVMTKEGYIRHCCNHLGDESRCGNGDASTLRAACHRDLGRIHFGVASRRVDGAEGIREDAAVVVMPGFENPFGHAAGKMG